MVAPVVLRVDQNSVIVPPGAAERTSDVKNSIRGALGLMTRVGVGRFGRGVLVGPKIEVGDGPPVGEPITGVGVIVGEISKPGVREAVGVNVGVKVGMSVGITCTAVAPHPLMSSVRNKNNVR